MVRCSLALSDEFRLRTDTTMKVLQRLVWVAGNIQQGETPTSHTLVILNPMEIYQCLFKSQTYVGAQEQVISIYKYACYLIKISHFNTMFKVFLGFKDAKRSEPQLLKGKHHFNDDLQQFKSLPQLRNDS